MMDEELRMFTLFQMTPDLVCIVNKEGFFQKINPAVCNKLGYTEEELMSVPVASFIHPDDKELTARERNKLLNNQPLLNFQNRYCTRSGETVWLEWTSVYLPEKELVFAIAKDITVHKTKEKELQKNYERFRQLATHFKNDIEKDRREIAANLHEDLAQLATAVKTKLEWVSAQEFSAGMELQMQSITETISLLVNNIRKLSYTISPGNIADLGLGVALQSLCTEFSALTGIECSYDSSFREEALSYEVKLDMYRVSQEALLNIMQHAEASLVTMSVQHDDENIRLLITDNGKGFNQHFTKPAEGFTTMYGRALSINGHLNISSNGSGTSIELIVATLKEQKLRRKLTSL